MDSLSRSVVRHDAITYFTNNCAMALAFSEILKTRSPSAQENHSFFISVLEKVDEILQPFIPREAFEMAGLVNAAMGTGSETGHEFSNAFSALEIYEPSADFLNYPDVEILAFAYLLANLLKLRLRVANLWDGYAKGILNPASVSVTTNTAINLTQSLNKDMAPLIDKHGGVEALLSQYFYAYCLLKG